jgi:hypothetical protein
MHIMHPLAPSASILANWANAHIEAEKAIICRTLWGSVMYESGASYPFIPFT